MENNIESLQKIKIRTTVWPATPLLGIYLKNKKKKIEKVYALLKFTTVFSTIITIIYNSQDMETSIHQWMNG